MRLFSINCRNVTLFPATFPGNYFTHSICTLMHNHRVLFSYSIIYNKDPATFCVNMTYNFSPILPLNTYQLAHKKGTYVIYT